MRRGPVHSPRKARAATVAAAPRKFFDPLAGIRIEIGDKVRSEPFEASRYRGAPRLGVNAALVAIACDHEAIDAQPQIISHGNHDAPSIGASASVSSALTSERESPARAPAACAAKATSRPRASVSSHSRASMTSRQNRVLCETHETA